MARRRRFTYGMLQGPGRAKQIGPSRHAHTPTTLAGTSVSERKAPATVRTPVPSNSYARTFPSHQTTTPAANTYRRQKPANSYNLGTPRYSPAEQRRLRQKYGAGAVQRRLARARFARQSGEKQADYRTWNARDMRRAKRLGLFGGKKDYNPFRKRRRRRYANSYRRSGGSYAGGGGG